MDKNERAKAEIRHMTKDLLLGVNVAKLLMDSEGDGYGDMLVDTLIEELQKMKSGKAPKPKSVIAMGAEKKHYIGTKLIQAEPAWRITDPSGNRYIQTKDVNACCQAGSNIEDGYRVVYEDGYESWSPKEVFEAAYRPTSGINFGLAIEAAKMGKKISRKGWNGRGQYVELASNISYKNAGEKIVNADHSNIGSAALAFVGTSGVQLGWLASQADMLADDWYIVEEPVTFKADVAASEATCNCCGQHKEDGAHE